MVYVPNSPVKETLEQLVVNTHTHQERFGHVNPAEVAIDSGVDPSDPNFVDYVGFVQNYESLLGRWRVEDKEITKRDPVDWSRVRRHALGGSVIGGVFGGVFGALLVGAAYAFAIYGEEKTEEVKTDLRGSYLGTLLGGFVGVCIGYPLSVMITASGATLADASLHQMDKQESYTRRFEAYKQLTQGKRPEELERLLKETEKRIIYERLNLPYTQPLLSDE